MNEKISIVNAIVYLLFFLVLYRKRRKLTISIFVLAFYTFGSIMSIFFVQHPLFSTSTHGGELTIRPYLYLFFTFLLFYYPLSKFDENTILEIKPPPRKQVDALLTIMVPAMLVTLLLYLPHFFSLLQNPLGLAANKIERMSGGNSIIFPFPLGTIVLLGKISADIALFLFFYILTSNSYSTKIKILIGIIVLATKPIVGIVEGSRATLTFFVFDLFFCYQIFNKQFGLKMKRIAKKIGVFFAMVFLLLLILLTLSRFSDTAKGVDFYLIKYFGESFTNFNILLFNEIENHTNGAKNFNLITNLLGFTNIVTIDDMRDYAEMVTGIPNNYFYTFIGNFFIDFGFTGTLLIALAAFTFLRKRIRSNKVVGLSHLFFVFFYANLLMRGFFYFPFAAFGNLTLILLFILLFLTRYRLKFNQ